MKILPDRIFWAILSPNEYAENARNWRRAKRSAKLFSAPLTLLHASVPVKMLDSLRLSKDQLEVWQNELTHRLTEQLETLVQKLEQKQIESNYQLLEARPFYEAVKNEVKYTANAWLLLEDNAYHDIPNVLWQLIRHSPVPLYITRKPRWQDQPLIVAAIDPSHVSDPEAALDHVILNYALTLAKKCNAALHVIHCYTPTVFASEHTIQQQLENLHQELFLETVEQYEFDDKQLHLIPNTPADGILNLCKGLDADLLIMGAVSRSSIERLFIGSTVEEILQRLESDLLLVKNDA